MFENCRVLQLEIRQIPWD